MEKFQLESSLEEYNLCNGRSLCSNDYIFVLYPRDRYNSSWAQGLVGMATDVE